MASKWEADAGPVHVEFTNGARIAAGFKVAPKAMKTELRKAHTRTAKEAQGWIRTAAQSGTPQQRHMANAIVGGGNSTQAVIRIRPRKTGNPKTSTAGAQGAFWGAKKYPQFPAWVGNTWKPATAGQGPYVINPTLAAKQGDLETIFLQGQADALARAVPRF